jgi:hypothetical protein
MTTVTDLTPHHFSVEDYATAHSAYSWSTRLDMQTSTRYLRKLPPAARRDLLMTTEIYLKILAALVAEDTPLPDHVEGHSIGVRGQR